MPLEFDPRKITELRKKKKINQDELSKAVGVTKNAVSWWERGERSPKVADLAKIANALGTRNFNQFFKEVEVADVADEIVESQVDEKKEIEQQIKELEKRLQQLKKEASQ